MPRKPRMYLPGVPSHVVQRENDRQACFFEQENYLFYLDCVGQAYRRYEVALHAYVLMTNHVHLLMTPATEIGISRVMQLVGNRYVQYINKSYRRTGTLWEGRHKASLIDAERYLLTCYRYIELNPVRAGMVAHPGDYPWSSFRNHTMGQASALIQDHDVFYGLGSTVEERCYRYRELFRTCLNDGEIHDIRRSASYSMPLGDDRFKIQIESMLRRSVGYAARGRPSAERCSNMNPQQEKEFL